jgi:anti-sigma factor RsiW
MRCEECFVLLDDYIEHELNAKNTDRVAAHLAACETCVRSYQELIREQKAYAQYLLGVEATPALWNNLQASIEEEKEFVRYHFCRAYAIGRHALSVCSIFARRKSQP